MKVVQEVSSLLGNRKRLRARGFNSTFELLNELEIDRSSFYRDLKDARISDRNLERLIGALSTEEEKLRLAEMYHRADAAPQSIASLLTRRMDENRFGIARSGSF